MYLGRGKSNLVAKKLFFVAILIIAGIFCLSVLSNSDDGFADDSGDCGDGVKWTYTSTTGELKIISTGQGTGKMTDYNTNTNRAPWSSKPYLNEIATITISDGVTHIGSHAFYNFYNLTSVSIGNTVKTLSLNAFATCILLETIHIPASVEEINDLAFNLFYPDHLADQNPGYTFARFQGFTVDDNNQFFKAIDGVLFSKDGKILLKYPEGKLQSSYTIPSGVEVIGGSGFARCNQIEGIIMLIFIKP